MLPKIHFSIEYHKWDDSFTAGGIADRTGSRCFGCACSKNNQKIDEVSVRDVQNAILDAKGYLLPYLDVPVTDVKFASYQRIGSTGILKEKGRTWIGLIRLG